LSASDRRQRLEPAGVDDEDLREAAAWIVAGGIVAYPTDTYYGLAADPASPAALQHLFDLKGREPSMAVPLIAASLGQVEAAVGRLRGASARLARAFWPGPLSLVLDAPAWMASAVHGGRRTVAIRVPDHAVARALAGAFGRPVTATSANRTGDAPAETADDLTAFAADPRVFVIDGGRTRGGAPSTLVDARAGDPVCVRAGAIAWDRVLTSR